MKKTILTFLAACAVSLASAQELPPAAAEPQAAAGGVAEPKASVLLIGRFRWATLYDYGVASLPRDVFTEPGACEREAQRLETAGPHGEPLFSLKDGKLEPAPHFVCQAITTENDQAWASYLLARREKERLDATRD